MILLFKVLHFGCLPFLPFMVCFCLLLLFSLLSSPAPPLCLADCSSSMVCFSWLLLFLFFLLMLLHYAWLNQRASWLSFSCDCQFCYRDSIWWLRCDDNQHPFLGADGVHGRWSIPYKLHLKVIECIWLEPFCFCSCFLFFFHVCFPLCGTDSICRTLLTSLEFTRRLHLLGFCIGFKNHLACSSSWWCSIPGDVLTMHIHMAFRKWIFSCNEHLSLEEYTTK